MSSPAIPIEIESTLLPPHSSSVLALLQFPLPPVALDSPGDHQTVADFFSDREPDKGLHLDDLRSILVPHRSTVRALALASRAATLNGARSVHCRHITYGAQPFLHLWVITYWCQVIDLRDNHRQPWALALERLNLFKERWPQKYGPEGVKLVEQAFAALSSLSWAGPLRGFLEREPKYKLAEYTTCKWLSDTHENQMLDLLRSRLRLSPSNRSEPLIRNTDFAMALITAWRRYKEDGTYTGRRAFAYLHEVGCLLQSGGRQLATIMLINKSHWVAVVLDFAQSIIFYGDSNGALKPDRETEDALTWWTSFHSGRVFGFKQMEVTRQQDSFSCGLLAWNALMRFFFPASICLVDARDVDMERLRVLLDIIRHHLDQDVSMASAPAYELSFNPGAVSDDDEPSIVSFTCSTPATQLPNFPKQTSTPSSILPPAPSSPLTQSPSPFDSVQHEPSINLKRAAPLQPSLEPAPSKRQKTAVSSAISRAVDLATESPTRRPVLLGFFKVCTKEEYNSQMKQMAREAARKQEADEARKERQEELRHAGHRERDRLRQKKHRQLLREAEIQNGMRSPGGTRRKHLDVVLQPETDDKRNIAELSRPARQILDDDKLKNKKTCGRKHKKDRKPAKYVNWHEPFLWSQILEAARHPSVGYRMSPTAIRHQLIVSNPKDFGKISANTIEGWIDRSNPDRARWSEKALKMAANGSRPSSEGGRTGVLKPYPDVVDTLVDLLDNLRSAGAPLSLMTIRGLTIATILTKAPQVFEKRAKDGSVFRCSDSWMKKWLHRTMHWSERRATRAAQKLPADWEDQCEKSFLRLAHDIKEHDIPSELYVNTDQSQGVYAQGANFTWAETGSKQVSTVGSDEKRAMTIVVSVSNSGVLLPFQAVYQGASRISCPKKGPANQEDYENAEDAGFHFEFSGNQTYWSTQKTMKQLVNDIIAPYFEQQKKRLGLPPRQKSLWQIDVWSVHRSDEFRSWVRGTHPNIIVHFVPGGCTGVFQPCDVGIQRIMKHSLKRSYHNDIVNEVLGQFEGGVKPADVKFDRSVGVLRDRTVSWLWNAYTALNKVEIVKRAFKQCKTKEFDLSYETLTGFAAREKLRNLKDSNDPFWIELNSKRAVVIDEKLAKREDDDVEDDGGINDSVIPVDVIVDHVIRGKVPQGIKALEDDEQLESGLQSTAEIEVLTWEDSLEDESMLLPVEPEAIERAPGKRKVKPVKRYTGEKFWRH